MSEDRIREPLPSLYAEGGYLSFDISDLWELLADKLPAEQLAENLWAKNPTEVRRAFNALILRKYDTFTDAERRSMMEALQYHVHNTALDRAVTYLAALEGAAHQRAWDIRQRGHYNRWIKTVQEFFGEHAPEAYALFNERYPHPFKQLEKEGQDANNVVGPAWNDARKHWREQCEAIFLAPTEPPHDPPSLDDIVPSVPYF